MMKMHMLSGGRLRMAKRIYLPDARRGEMFELPVSCVLLRHAQGNVLFDTGCHPDVAVDPQGRLGVLARYMTPIMPADDHVLAGLKAVGFGPDDIDVVICSHLHTDHCGCNAFFKKATIFVHALEIEAANAPNALDRGYIRADWDHPLEMKIFDQQMDVFGDGKLTLIPLPGHSKGTTGALVKLDRSGEFLLASDALSVRANLDQRTSPRNSLDVDQFLKSLDEIAKLEAAGVKIICGHDDAQWAGLQKGAHAYT
ncbi:N-acyl homoserine lactonase family protein [Bradyrhizobium erythrophlei]|uniref:N-acyl homoserine lactonase family protein n=1 Tax=Bradyrhizobium erythrophlei TaxID=1437360 RepID=UPI0035E5E2A3